MSRDVAVVRCAVDGCAAPVKSRGWCVKHYSRWLRHGDATAVAAPRVCRWSDCGRPTKALGLCAMHYRQQWRGQELRDHDGRSRSRGPVEALRELSIRLMALGVCEDED